MTSTVTNSDQTFRIILVIGAVLLLPAGFYYRLKSQSKGETLDRRQEGLAILLTLRPIGLAGAIGLIAFMVNPSSMAWSFLPLPNWLRWSGVGVGIAGGGLLLWTFHTLGPNLTDTVVTRRTHTLVTHGPYRWVRHPFYDSGVLCVLASSLLASNWFLLLTGTLAILLLVVRTRKEEKNLLKRFGDDYRAYMQSTGRFWPKSGS
jgi:protein-S-isoprenylcysteine O-methyltransferase Ste14